MRSLFYIALCSVILCLFPACDRTPDHIIKPKAMEDLLVDIHKSEAIIEIWFHRTKRRTAQRRAKKAWSR